jgi:hypothetical protein
MPASLGGAAAAATTMQWRERTAAGVTPACSSEPPPGGSAAEPGLGGFCQLVRVVSRRHLVGKVRYNAARRDREDT